MYIRAFQQASDLDDTVEDKLLVGDRPKQSHDPESKLPLKERLAIRKQDELDEVHSVIRNVWRTDSDAMFVIS